VWSFFFVFAVAVADALVCCMACSALIVLGRIAGAAAGGSTRREGDWDCSGCFAHNYASRAECFKCKAAKPAGAGTGMPGMLVLVSCAGRRMWIVDGCLDMPSLLLSICVCVCVCV
jgi:hypothetical protein